MTDLTQHPEWEKEFLEFIENGGSPKQAFWGVAPLIYAAGRKVGLEEIEQNRIDLEKYCRENERLKKALNTLITACDNGKWIETGAGGMSVDSQTGRTYINRVPAYAVEEAREALEDVV